MKEFHVNPPVNPISASLFRAIGQTRCLREGKGAWRVPQRQH
jgi:hypothetical protein